MPAGVGLAGIAATAQDLQRPILVAAEGDLVHVVGREVVARVGGDAVARAPVTVFGAVGVDCGTSSCTVARFTSFGPELPLVPVVGATVLGAA